MILAYERYRLPNMGIRATDILHLKTRGRIASNRHLVQFGKGDSGGFAIGFLFHEERRADPALLDLAVAYRDLAIASDSRHGGNWSRTRNGEPDPQRGDRLRPIAS